MVMKKLLSLITALAICAFVVSCGNGGESTADTTVDTNEIVTSGIDSTTGTTNAVQTTEVTTEASVVPEVEYGENDVVTLTVGKYINLIYNPAYCNITSNIEKGVGSRETVTLTIQMKDGYIFDGWSQEKAIANGGKKASTSAEYTVIASKDTTIWANYSANIVYNPNGGKVNSGGETYTQSASVVWYKCPNTLPEKNYFVREGYTLVEYNTKADGTGTAVSLGSRTVIPEEGNLTLYCIWEKQNDESDFTTKLSDTGVAITQYNGTVTNVVIPDTIGGKNVVAIASDAFSGSSVERVVLSKNVETVEDGAFKNCKKLETFVMFDSLMEISDSSFSGSALKNLRVNAVLDMYKEWTVGMINIKFDRLLYAIKNQKDIFAIYGGSGAYYGFNCEAIDKALDEKYEVINLGCNAHLSASIIFEYLSCFLGENDTLLWAPEAGPYMFGSTAFSNRTWEFLVAYYDIFRYVDISNYSGVFNYYSLFASNHAKKQQSFDSFSDSTNGYGDNTAVVAHEDKTYDGYSTSYGSQARAILKGTYSYIEGIIERMSENGVRLYYTFAAMDESATALEADVFENLANAVEEKFGMVVISEYTNCLIPHEYMYNSEWHLTLEGAKLRTENLVNDILAQLEKEG